MKLSKLEKEKARVIRRHKGRGPIAPRPGVAFIDRKKQQDKYACRGKYVSNCFLIKHELRSENCVEFGLSISG